MDKITQEAYYCQRVLKYAAKHGLKYAAKHGYIFCEKIFSSPLTIPAKRI